MNCSAFTLIIFLKALPLINNFGPPSMHYPWRTMLNFCERSLQAISTVQEQLYLETLMPDPAEENDSQH